MDIVTADRISDRIVDVLNTELAAMKLAGKIDGIALLSAWCLAFKALEKTMPPQLPGEVFDLGMAVDAVLLQTMGRVPGPDL